MLVEIPDPDVIMQGAVVFLAGMFGLFLYYKAKPYLGSRHGRHDQAVLEQLRYYEEQLVDMKIRLDALSLDGGRQAGAAEPPAAVTRDITQKDREPPAAPAARHENVRTGTKHDVIEEILRLITDQPMTSHDIQVTVGRSREHISRLMKKIASEGLARRSAGSKPYTYLLTPKGRARLGLGAAAPAAS